MREQAGKQILYHEETGSGRMLVVPALPRTEAPGVARVEGCTRRQQRLAGQTPIVIEIERRAYQQWRHNPDECINCLEPRYTVTADTPPQARQLAYSVKDAHRQDKQRHRDLTAEECIAR